VTRRIHKFCQILQILWRHTQFWTRFPGDRLIVSRCCFWLFFVIFWVLSDRYRDKNWSSSPIKVISFSAYIFLLFFKTKKKRRFWSVVGLFQTLPDTIVKNAKRLLPLKTAPKVSDRSRKGLRKRPGRHHKEISASRPPPLGRRDPRRSKSLTTRLC